MMMLSGYKAPLVIRYPVHYEDWRSSSGEAFFDEQFEILNAIPDPHQLMLILGWADPAYVASGTEAAIFAGSVLGKATRCRLFQMGGEWDHGGHPADPLTIALQQAAVYACVKEINPLIVVVSPPTAGLSSPDGSTVHTDWILQYAAIDAHGPVCDAYAVNSYRLPIQSPRGTVIKAETAALKLLGGLGKPVWIAETGIAGAIAGGMPDTPMQAWVRDPAKVGWMMADFRQRLDVINALPAMPELAGCLWFCIGSAPPSQSGFELLGTPAFKEFMEYLDGLRLP